MVGVQAQVHIRLLFITFPCTQLLPRTITDNMNITAVSLLALFAGLLPLASAQNNSATYTNPVLEKVGADPFILKDDGYYYLTYTTATNITILRSTSMTDWDNAEVKLAFDPPV